MASGSQSYTFASKDSSSESLIVCARTVQAVRDRNACFTTETERRNPQTDLAECAPMRTEAGRRDADRRCHLVFTGRTSMLHRQRFCKSTMSRPGCSCVCYTRQQKPTLTPKLLISQLQKKQTASYAFINIYLHFY